MDVELGVEQAEAEAGALAAWLTGVREHRPFVVWKVAATLDGRVAAADGTSRWITGEQARAAVHRLRATCDAVVVGSGTAVTDDPQLTVRDAEGRNVARQPLRVVVDRRGPRPGHRPRARRRGAHARQPGRIPAELLAELFDRDVRRVLLEGGPTLAAAFLRDGLVDELVVHLAPKLLGAGPVPGQRPGNSHDRRRAVPLDRRRHPPGRGRATPVAPDPAHWWAAVRGRRELRCSPASSKRWAPSSSARTSRDAAVLQIRADRVLEGVALGDSIAVNGVCLTVTGVEDGVWSTDVMAETLSRSSLGSVTAGAPVNLERAVTPHTRLGGHMMQGHVDGVGRVVGRVRPASTGRSCGSRLPPDLARYVVEKGSIAVDGVSLTVSAVSAADIPEPWFEVSLIPTTLRETTLGARAPGEPVNLEVDVIAKYVERLLGGRS